MKNVVLILNIEVILKTLIIIVLHYTNGMKLSQAFAEVGNYEAKINE